MWNLPKSWSPHPCRYIHSIGAYTSIFWWENFTCNRPGSRGQPTHTNPVLLLNAGSLFLRAVRFIEKMASLYANNAVPNDLYVRRHIASHFPLLCLCDKVWYGYSWISSSNVNYLWGSNDNDHHLLQLLKLGESCTCTIKSLDATRMGIIPESINTCDYNDVCWMVGLIALFNTRWHFWSRRAGLSDNKLKFNRAYIYVSIGSLRGHMCNCRKLYRGK